jgi:hypothetical protein
MKKDLFFIVGIGRSGTTVLTSLLNKHPQLHCLPEANFLVFFLKAWKDHKSYSEKDVNSIFQEIIIYSASHPWLGWEFNPEEVRQKVLAATKNNSQFSFQQLCEMIYREFRISGDDKPGTAVLIDKNPSYTIYMNEIYQNVDAKFIYLVRDYRANVLSRKQSVYYKSDNIAFNAQRWKLFNKMAYRFYKKNPADVLLLRYEDLVSHPQRELSRIFQFTGVKEVEYRPQQKTADIDIDRIKIDERFKERFRKKYSDLNKPLNAERLRAWEKQLNDEEIALSEAICGKFAMKLGYQKVKNNSAFTNFLICLHHLPQLIMAYLNVKKDKLIYFLPPAIKLRRLENVYRKLGFIK